MRRLYLSTDFWVTNMIPAWRRCAWTRRSVRSRCRFLLRYAVWMTCCAIAIATFVISSIIFARTLLIQHRRDVRLGALIEESRDVVDEARSLERIERLAGALKIPTVSYQIDHEETQPFLLLHEYLQKSMCWVNTISK